MSAPATEATEATEGRPDTASVASVASVAPREVLNLSIPPETVEAIARRAAELLAARVREEPDPWVGVDEAATHLGCPRSRIYALASCKPARIPFERDGSRLVFKRSELDSWVRAGGGKRP